MNLPININFPGTIVHAPHDLGSPRPQFSNIRSQATILETAHNTGETATWQFIPGLTNPFTEFSTSDIPAPEPPERQTSVYLNKPIEEVFNANREGFIITVTNDPRWEVIQPLVDSEYRRIFRDDPEYMVYESNIEPLLQMFRHTASPIVAEAYIETLNLPDHLFTRDSQVFETIMANVEDFPVPAWPCLVQTIERLVINKIMTQAPATPLAGTEMRGVPSINGGVALPASEGGSRQSSRLSTPRLNIRSPASRGYGSGNQPINHMLRDPRYKIPSEDPAIMETQVYNLRQCIYSDTLFTHRELAEQIAPLCKDFRIDTTIITEPLYQYDDAKRIWRRNVNSNQLENWIDQQIKGMIEHEIPPLNVRIVDLTQSLPPEENATAEARKRRKDLEDDIQKLESSIRMLELRLKTMGGKNWASNVAACLMPKLYNLSNLEEIDSQGIKQPIFGNRIEGNRYLFALQNNQVLDLKTVEIREREREDYCTLISGVTFDPTAPCEEFERFIGKLMCYIKEMVNFLAESICYTMSGDMILEVFFMCIGRPDCGKTSLFEILDAFFGEYQYEVPKSLYLYERHPRTGPDPTMLGTQHKRFGATAELGEHDIFDNPKMNALSTGQKVTVKAMYALENQSFKPSMKPWFHTNYIPKMHLDEAMVKRFIYFPMNHKFSKNPNPENKETESLIVKGFHRQFLTSQGLSGILNYLLPHLRRFINRNRNLPSIPQIMLDAIQDEVKARDTFQGWIDQCCDVTDPTGKIETHAALASYNTWAGDPSRRGKAKSYTTVNAFTTVMKARGYLNKPAKGDDKLSTRHYFGIKLRIARDSGDLLTNQLREAVANQIPQV
jgi:P4 family phage/plasmid primase-like protien